VNDFGKPTPSAGPPDETLATTIGPQLVSCLCGLLRSIQLYDPSNQTLRRQLAVFLVLLRGLTEDEIVLVAMGEHFYANGTRIKAPLVHVALFRTLSMEWEQRGIGALRFLPGLSQDELAVFLQVFSAATSPALAQSLTQRCEELGVNHVLLVRASDLASVIREAEAADRSNEERSKAQATYHRAVRTAALMFQRTAESGRPAIRHARHIVQPIVDTILKDEFSIVGLTAIKHHDAYTYAHSVNVGVLSVAIGQRLGLQRVELARLGVAAVLHDVGKVAVDPTVLQKAGALTDAEWSAIRRHPLEGFKIIARMPMISEMTLDALRVCLEHHRNVNGGGYPTIEGRPKPSILARIVAAADCFDAMTGHRAYRARPLTGFEALGQLLGPDRERFDPFVLWALIASVGFYPAGTLLLTSGGATLLSMAPNPSDPTRPFCRVLAEHGEPRDTERAGETWQAIPAHERVLRVIAPEEFPGDVEELLAA
jgi:HD-GYP domain-containing protein (c-di-GMP phosphodiesterase class II)